MILATDMSKHFDFINAFSVEETDKTSIFKCCIKAADVAHTAKTWDLHLQWTTLLMKEFFKQGDTEKEKNLEVSFNCDREKTDISKSQSGFIGTFVIPLYQILSKVVESEEIEKTCIQQLKLNRSIWENVDIKLDI